MSGLYGGALEATPESASEVVPAYVCAAFHAEGPLLSATPSPDAERASVVPFGPGADDTLQIQADLRGLSPFPVTSPDLPRSDSFKTLTAVARALLVIHEAERAHGDLRPGTVWVGSQRCVLLAPGRAVDAPALLAARLRAGSPATEVGFVAPEIARGEAATQASDVYGLAAMAYAAVTGEVPLGRPGPGRLTRGVPARLTRLVNLGLRADPEGRPSVEELIDAFSAAAAYLEGEAAPAPAEATGGKGSNMSALLVAILILGGSFVFCGAFGFVIAGWTDIPSPVQFLLLCGMTGLVWGAGLLLERRGYVRSGLAGVILGSQLLWVNLAHSLVLTDLDGSEGAWAAGSACLTAVVYLLAVRRRSLVLGILGALGFMVASLAFGQAISSGSRYGDMIYMACIGAAYAGLGALGHRLVGRGGVIGVPFLVCAVFWVWVSAGSSFDLLERDSGDVFAICWLYALSLAPTALALRLRLPQAYRALSLVCGLTLLAFGPTVQALVNDGVLPWLLWVVALGLGILAAAFKLEALHKTHAVQISAILAGLFNVLFAPSVVCIERCFGKDGVGLLTDALNSLGRVHETRFVYLSMTVGISMGLVGLGFLFSREAGPRKSSYRLLEVAGLGAFFFITSVLSLPDVTHEFFYVTLIVGGASATIALGVWAQRVMLVGIASLALLLNLVIQYFAKLSDHMHWSLLALGFGVGVLVAAIVYERKVKHLLPKLKEWA